MGNIPSAVWIDYNKGMNLYNTQTLRVEPFQPRDHNVGVYVCGITPYDTTHLGHAFTYTTFDILIRYLEIQGQTVTYVQNVTDIDDDILRKAREVGEDWRSLGNRWTAHFIRDMQSLNVRPPDYYPRATSVIPEIIGMVEKLLQQGLAYEAGGSVYYHVSAWPEFGKLSHLPKEEMLPVANEHGNRPDDPNKQDPLDFVLWQAQAPGEPAWDSPWGPGRPGWHIECSAMSTRYLGETVDIHSGGGDLIFPHHECEIAQVEPLSRRPFVRTWMHVAMVSHEGEKMSKSLGNLVMINDLLKTWFPDAIRIYLGMHHYREPWGHSEEELAEAGRLAEKLRQAAMAASENATPLEAASDADGRLVEYISEAEQRYREAMEDDLDTPEALAALSEMASEILSAAHSGHKVGPAQRTLRTLAGVFGLRLDSDQPELRVTNGWQRHLGEFEG
jgi:L-cysteine:1D-myo-inositol 2-amino-2-deoxy-alpha-D-glucopyranoside ligase